MADVNLVVLVGRLTRDPEVRYTPSGTAIAQLGLAIGRKYKDQSGQLKEDTTFVDIDVFGRQAETAGQYLAKGRTVLIEGRLQLDQWEDKNSGQKRSKLKVVGNRVQFLGGPGEGGGGRSGGGGGGGGGPRGGGRGRGQGGGGGGSANEPPPEDANLDIPEDDIPF